jgi:hypothetical protein
MNWGRAILAGVIGGFVVSLADYILHGMIMGNTYAKYPVFSQTQANPVWFILIAIVIGIFAAILFAKTRKCWAEGWKGGMTYGFWVAMVAFFANFYFPLVLAGFPYYLGWCWGGINVIEGLIGGAVLGLIYKQA